MGLVSFLFSLNGRITRGQYWLGTIIVTVVNWLVMFASTSASMSAAQHKDPTASLSALSAQAAIFLPLSLAGAWIGIAMQVKRFHDRGQSGWWSLLPLAPIALMVMNVFTAIGEHWPIERMFASMGLPFLALMLISLGFFINLGCLPGTDGPNKYDAPPPGSPGSPREPSPFPRGQASLGGVEAAMERAIADKARQPAAPVKAAARAPSPSPLTGASAGASFGRRPAR